jgi:hypothetical protein
LVSPAKVVAFEMDSNGRGSLAAMARLNGVEDRLVIRNKCEPVDLIEIACKYTNAIYLIDVEGYESTLLSLPVVPFLSKAGI